MFGIPRLSFAAPLVSSFVAVLDIALRFRRTGYRFVRTLTGPSMAELSFVWELGEIAAGGGDIRPRVLGLD